jgi:hypothetical protein
MYVQTTYGNVKEKPLMLQLGKDQIYMVQYEDFPNSQHSI